MQTFKEILSRQEERQNLRNMAFCLLLVLGLILGTFGAIQIHFFPHRRPAESPQEFVSGEPHVYP